MSYYSVIVGDSPTVYWRLGEASGTSANDEIGTNDGTYVNTPTLGVTGALTYDSNTGVTFDRTIPESVTAGSSISFASGGWTVEMWFKRNAATTTNQQLWYIGGAADASLQINGIRAGGFRLWGYGGVLAATSASAGDITDDNWHHIVVTKDASHNYKIYIDKVDRTTVVASPAWTTGSYAFTFPRTDYEIGGGSYDEVAIWSSTALSSTQVGNHYDAFDDPLGPAWTTPADTVGMSTTPELQFDSPVSAVAQHFQLQLDTANTFNTGSLRTYDSSTDQTNWTYWNGSTWTALPGTGLPSGSSGNEVRYTVTSALTAATWYRRVRAGTGG